jgi:hypothetical protein
MFGDKIKIHPGSIGELQNIEMTFVEINVGERRMIVLLHVIKESELHEWSLFRQFLLDFLQ